MSSGIRSSRKEEEEGEEHCPKEWLDLGLGIGPGDPKAEPAAGQGPSGVTMADQEMGELGLGLGFGDDGVRQYGDDHGQLQQESSSASLPPPPLHQPSSSPHVPRAGFDRENPHPVDSSTRPDGPRNGAGIWFSLRAACSLNGEGDDALPQIPKAYIRVKDESATVFMVKTYLVRKLGIADESEIEITCMGQKLEQSQTLKDVRDGVWFPRFMAEYSLNESTSESLGTDDDKFAPIDHFMSLYYQMAGQLSLD